MCIFSAIGQYQQAKSQQEMSEYQAEMSDITQRQYDRLAEDTLEQGEWEKRNLGLQQLSQLGQARTVMAGSGVQMGSGSALEYEMSFADVADMDMRQIDYDIQSRTYEARMGAWNAGNQSNMYRAQADAYGQQAGWSLAGGIADAGIQLGITAATAGAAGLFNGLGSAGPLNTNWSFGMGAGGFDISSGGGLLSGFGNFLG